MKKILTISLIALLLIISGCSNNSVDTSVVNDEDTLVIGVDENYPPFGFVEEGEITGFDIALAEETAKRLGMDLEIVSIDWQEKEEELDSGKIDVIWSGLTITPERQEQMLFTDPYLKINPVFVVKEDSEIQTIDDLKDKVIGVQEESAASDILKNLPIYDDIDHETLFEENINALKNLDVGLTDAVIVDSAVANWYITDQNADYRTVGDLEDIYIGVGVAKNNEELKNKLDQALEEIKSDGTYDQLSIEWFGEVLPS